MSLLPYKERYVTINGSAGAAVTISSTVAARHVEIVEAPDPTTFTGAFTALGLVVERPAANGTFQTLFTPNVSVRTTDKLDLGNQIAEANGAGPLLGGPAQTDPAGRTIAATALCKVRSAAAGATTVRVREIY